MKCTELIPTTNSGYVYSENTQYYAKKEQGGKVAAVHFFNQGSVSSVVRIEYGGAAVELARGAAFAISAPINGYDITTYDISFIVSGGAQTNKLVLTVQKYLCDEK